MGDLTVLDVDVELKFAASLFFELFDLTSLGSMAWRHTMVPREVDPSGQIMAMSRDQKKSQT